MTVRLLLDSKAAVHARDFGGVTPLHFAASGEKTQLVRQLVQADADPLARDGANHIPLLCSY